MVRVLGPEAAELTWAQSICPYRPRSPAPYRRVSLNCAAYGDPGCRIFHPGFASLWW